MKKSITALSLFCILLLSACNSGEISDSSTSSESTNSTSTSSSSSTTASAESSEPEVPAGEPTFLTCPDGTVIYTSQISKYQNMAEFHGTHEQYPLDTFNKETFTAVECPQIVCEGFAYGFFPRFTVSVTEAPENFAEETEDGRTYSGEELPRSYDYFRINVGDKFGSLTVKSAQAIFSNYFAQREEEVDPDTIPGIYLSDGEIEYEGEIEMTGCIVVMETEGYNSSGDMWFFPDGDCVSNIPAVLYEYIPKFEPKGICHRPAGRSGDLNYFDLGNMSDYDIDYDGLEPGDEYVRVKITIKDPVIKSAYGYMACLGEPVAIEVLR